MKMEEKLRLELELEQSSTYQVEAGADDLEFYETIEAPKFVDFTRPNHFCPDDRYWFCSRVGCNQKHEEEINPEAIYKDFVLRVMAARSPNVRFRRALSRKPPSDSKICPMSAPPKSSKSRIPRLALLSSISRKLITDDEKGTIRPASAKAAASTPKTRVKHVAAKYMTSPRKKKGGSPNPNAFRSVRNPEKTSITISKNKVVAKALLFSSPKKAVKVQTSESANPVTKLCEGVKKLAITSEKKGSTRKPVKESTRVKKLLPFDASMKQSGAACKPKKQKECSKPLKEHSAKTSRCIKVKAKPHIPDRKKQEDGVSHDAGSGDEPSDMEIDEKSRAGSLDLCLKSVKSKSEEKSDGSSRTTDSSTSQKEPTSSSDRPLTSGSSDGLSSATSTSELIPVTDSEGSEQHNEPSETKQKTGDRDSATDLVNQEPGVVGGELVDNYDKENAAPDSEDTGSEQQNSVTFQEPHVTDKRKGNTNEVDLENQKPGVVVGGQPNNDDKENDAFNSNDLRNVNGDNLSKHGAPVNSKVKKIQKLQRGEKTMKENCSTVITQGVKYKKLKPTNPKPFRLRTDERGILKEATLERKVHSQENSTVTSENSHCTENGTSATREKTVKKPEDRILKKVQFIPVKSKYKKTSKEAAPISSDRVAVSCSEKKTERASILDKQLVQPQRKTGSRVKPRGLSVTVKAATMSKPGGSKQQHKEVPVSTNKDTAARKLAAPGRKAATVPREPNFHTE